jgi:opacity protein-like surface antigen
MKKSLLIGLLMAVAFAVVVPKAFNAFAEKTVELGAFVQKEKDKDKDKDKDWDDNSFSEKEEFRQTYQLSPGAQVNVSGINGRVEIETTNGSAAEVYIVRSARTKDDLQYRKIIIEPSAASLVIRGENDKERDRSYGRDREVRQQVFLKVPRQIDLTASGVNGRVNVGEVDGPVTVSGVNGRVDVAQALGYSKLSGINGRVTVTIARLGERGARISGINGGVEIRFADQVNADLEVTGINGNVSAELPDVTVQGKVDKNNFRAKIGAGGSPIHVSGINGRVTLTRGGSER